MSVCLSSPHASGRGRSPPLTHAVPTGKEELSRRGISLLLQQRDPAERSEEITSKPQPEADKRTDI